MPTTNLLCPLLTSAPRSGDLPAPSVLADTMQISRGKLDRLHRTPAESTALAHGERWTSRIRARSSDQDCLYSVSVRQVATLLPRFFQTAPRDDRPCASLALCLTGPGQRTFTFKLSNMLGTHAPVEITKRFPQELGNLAQNARFPHSHKPILVSLTTKNDEEQRRMNRPQTGSLSERRTGLLSERRLQKILAVARRRQRNA